MKRIKSIPNQQRWFKYFLVTITMASLCLHCHADEIQLDIDDSYEMDPSNTNDGDFLEQISENVAKRREAMEQMILRIPELQAILPMFHWRWPIRNRTLDNSSHAVSQCNRDLVNLGFSLDNKWVLPLIDSYGKPASGLLKGNVFWTGSYDQCREFQAPITKLFPNGFRGRYCIMAAKVNGSPTPIQTGICVPNSCDTKDLNDDDSAIIKFLSWIPFVKDYVKKLPELSFRCLPEKVPLSTGAIVCIVVLCLAFGLMLIGTIYDAVQRRYKTNTLPIVFSYNHSSESKAESPTEAANGNIQKAPGEENQNHVESDKSTLVLNLPNNQPNKVGQILVCFSAIKNMEAILDTSEKAGQLNCLHGIRFISITWVILGHTYVFGMSQMGNVMDVLKAFNSFTFQAVSQATFSVDTFFLLSGFLLTYIFLKDRSKFTVKKLISFYTHRYVRLTPVYMMVLFAYATLFNFIGEGPYWNHENPVTHFCTVNWWKNMLYINNFYTVTEMCMGWSWYLSNDMQFFILSPIFLVLLKNPRRRHRYIGLAIILVLMFASWLSTLLITIFQNLEIMFEGLGNAANANTAEIQQYHEFDLIYDKPWTRIGPYLIGCLLGALYLEIKGARRFLQVKWQIIIWCASIALSLTDIYGLYNANIGLTTSAFYNSLARSAWSLTVAWVIFACLTGHGGPVDKFLSWKLWFPLSRLTYCAYLTHPLVMYFYYQTLTTPAHVSNTFVAIHYLGFTILTYALALVTSLLFEAPVIKLEKVLKGASNP